MIGNCDNCDRQSVPVRHLTGTYCGDTTQCYICQGDIADPYGELEDAPEVFVECEACDGEGAIEKHQPFHDDPYFCTVHPCEVCHGAGGMICEAE